MAKVVQEGDVIDVIVEQHKRIRQLFSEVTHGRGKARAKAFAELAHLLTVHEEAEEKVVHPVTRGVARGVAEARVHEEDEAKKLLGRLVEMGPDAEGFEEMFSLLKHDVDTHATNEQREEFPKLREHCDEDRLRAMAEEFRGVQALKGGQRSR
ncbi:hemerythrin domain-containing protein [Bailinhaonella thermotolerans]|uniref:Hemerythrin domain-containing protein n=1 Tax=Bailinhaonella thermotolerans TaxID=1070861 RepID=A0A3A4A7P3_9ACTN|nr:hemerythrin domain-containing protein [Bailinhaonella thermotolerans]RJL25036.1 hemerythrin domain-containing protein [Bailinhaonella thermotolerans]